MLKCASSIRKLEVIPFTISSSARLLKAYMGTARTNLDLTPMDTTNDCTVRMTSVIKLCNYQYYYRLMLDKNVCNVERIYLLLNLEIM